MRGLLERSAEASHHCSTYDTIPLPLVYDTEISHTKGLPWVTDPAYSKSGVLKNPHCLSTACSIRPPIRHCHAKQTYSRWGTRPGGRARARGPYLPNLKRLDLEE
jgi:hypothetical protein